MWQADTLVLVTLTFLAAGLVKGVVGLGLPTIVLGMLAIPLGITQAIAVLLVPSLVTNAVQGFSGPSPLATCKRLWPLLAAASLGILVGTGALARSTGSGPAVALGVLIALHGAISLLAPPLPHPGRHERWLSPVTGLLNGLITGFTGSAILPGVLFFQALGLDKERMVQGMGLLFCVSTAVLMAAFTQHRLLTAELAMVSTLALIPALLGLWLGAKVRRRIAEERFRRLLFLALIVLGVGIVWRTTG
jgi:uncharacterized protein